MNIFHFDPRLQFYMYDLMYVDPNTMAEEDYFPVTKIFLQTTRKVQLHDRSQNIGLDLVTLVWNIMS